MLGKGAYGGVYLVKKKNTNDFFAMKVIDFAGKVKIFSNILILIIIYIFIESSTRNI